MNMSMFDVTMEGNKLVGIRKCGPNEDIDHETISVYNIGTGKYQRAEKRILMARQKIAGWLLVALTPLCPITLPFGVLLLVSKDIIFDVFER